MPRRTVVPFETLAGMHTLLLFLKNLFDHWVAWAGGVLTMAPFFREKADGLLSGHPKARAFFDKHVKDLRKLALVCLAVGCYLAWCDEHSNLNVVTAEKQAQSILANDCELRSQVRDAYERGLQGSNLAQQQNLESSRNNFEKQQSTLNDCVTSLGKMNPVINARYEVTAIMVASTNGVPPSNIYAVVMATNHRASPVGKVSCAKEFTPGVFNGIGGTVGYGMVGYGVITKISPTEYSVSLSRDTGQWDATSPAFFLAHSADPYIGPCTFTPQ